MRILFVEGDEETRRLFTLLLRVQDFEVKTAETLATARRLLTNGDFDLLMTEILLPDGDGWELARLAYLRGTKAISLAASGTPSDISQSRDADSMLT